MLLGTMSTFSDVRRAPLFLGSSLLVVLGFLLTTPGIAQKRTTSRAASTPAKKAPNPTSVVATVGAESVLYRDVERAFQKNLTRRDMPFAAVPRDTAIEFIKLYTNYRLKVADARDRSIDKDQAVKDDIAANRKLLCETWFFDKTFADARIDELARRRTQEIKIAIILCAVMRPGETKWDSLASLAKAQSILGQLRGGATFEQVAKDSSDDKETGDNGGVLPWISGGSIIKVVEDEAYGLKVGSYSTTPVPSRFGYFIVKVLDRQPRAVVKFRHILLQKKDGRDSAASDALADSLLTILRAPSQKQAALLQARGITPSNDVFADVAKKFSDDQVSAPKGGYLGSAYSRSGGMESNNSRLAPTFEDAVFSLKDGQISGRVYTPFGVHIIIRDSTKLPDPVMERDNAKRSYRRLYFEEDKRVVFDSLKTAYGYRWNESALATVLTTIDTTKNTSDTSWWSPITSELSALPLYTMPQGALTVGGFVDSLRQRQDMRGYSLNRAGFDRAIAKISDPLVLAQATANLESKYDDLAALLREFSDGILLFKVEEQEVWSKLKFDTTDAKVFFDSTRSRWMTDQRYTLREIFVLADSASADIKQRLERGEDFTSLAGQFTQRAGGREKNGSLGTVSPRTSNAARIVEEQRVAQGRWIGPVRDERGWMFVMVERIVEPRPKTFEEAITEIATAYQDALQQRLTATWLDAVRTKHPVTMQWKTIDSIWGKGSTTK